MSPAACTAACTEIDFAGLTIMWFSFGWMKFSENKKLLLVSFEPWMFSRRNYDRINLSIKYKLDQTKITKYDGCLYSNIIFITCLRCEKLHLPPPLFRVYFYQTTFFTRMIVLLIVFFAVGFCQTTTNSVVGFFEPDPPFECPWDTKTYRYAISSDPTF